MSGMASMGINRCRDTTADDSEMVKTPVKNLTPDSKHNS